MSVLSERSPTRSLPPGHSAAPDWALVPFEVGCARCGADLRGLSEPKCPACGLDFEWSKAVPMDDLKCPACDYRLVGLTERRCPECGRPFTWAGILAAVHRRHIPLFEYQWRFRPVWSLLVTWDRALRPHKLWGHLDLHDEPQKWPLLAMVGSVLTITMLSTIVVHGVRLCLYRSRFPGSRLAWSTLPRCIGMAAGDEIEAGIVPLLVLWSVASLAALMVFRWSMQRCNVRRVQVLRVWAYAVPFVPLTLLTLEWLVLAIQCAAWSITRLPWFMSSPLPLALAGAAVVGHTTWSLWCGYRDYLRMPHAAAVAVASQVMSILLVPVVWDVAFDGRVEWLISAIMSSLLGQRWAG